VGNYRDNVKNYQKVAVLNYNDVTAKASDWNTSFSFYHVSSKWGIGSYDALVWPRVVVGKSRYIVWYIVHSKLYCYWFTHGTSGTNP
jgi:hypothetical protein